MEIDQSSDYNKDRSLDNTIKSISEEEKNPYDYLSTYKINEICIFFLYNSMLSYLPILFSHSLYF